MTTRRIIGLIIILIAILILPYWIYIPILFMAILVFPFFGEAIIFVLLINTMYGDGIKITKLLVSPLFISVVLTIIIMLPLRERLRFNV